METRYFKTICELYHCPTNNISFEFFTMLKKAPQNNEILWSIQASGESRWQQDGFLVSLAIPLYQTDAYLPRINTEKGEKGKEEERTPRPKQVPNWLNPMGRLKLKVAPRPLPSLRIWDPLPQHSPLILTTPHLCHTCNSLALTYIWEKNMHHFSLEEEKKNALCLHLFTYFISEAGMQIILSWLW